MYLVAGSIIPSYGTETSGRLSGSAVIYAPFIFTGGTSIMGTDSISGYCDILPPLSAGDRAEIYTGSAEVTAGRTDITTALSAMNTNTCSSVHASALSFTERAIWATSLSDRITGGAVLMNILSQDSLTGACPLSIPIGRTGIASDIIISLPMSTGRLSTDTLTLYADGKDITSRLISAEIDLFGVPSFSAVFLPALRCSEK